MANTNKGQASPRSSFFHITFHTDDRKWYSIDVHEGKRNSFATLPEAMKQVEKWVDESGQRESAHVYIHDEQGKIREQRTL